MSPRSEEYMVAARDHLAGARAALAGGSHRVAISAAYYALLRQAQKAQGLRWRADYGALAPTSEAAAAVVADAERFVAAVEELLA